MKTREKFDLLGTDIGPGAMLIEASAGTGKTFTIAVLVLRLLLERPEITIDRILVTTFTELATAELRGRIRTRLRDALAIFQGASTDDELLAQLHARHRNDPTAVDRLEAALINFDEAPIYTIHGFCQRVLAERAFESGTLFDAELLTNQRELLREIVHDFWRTRFYTGERLPALLALRGKISTRQLFNDVEELTKNPDLVVRPAQFRSYAEIGADITHVLTRLREDWEKEQAGIRELFRANAWAKGNHQEADYIASMLDHLDACLCSNTATLEQLECVETFAKSAVHKNTRAGKPKPMREVFDRCEEICALTAELLAALRAQFLGYARTQLRERKLTRNVVSYEDLLTRLSDALNGAGGDELAESIRSRYHAALIDEFQDTDPVQYSIFSRIYRGTTAPVAFIGDPKQAIYAFRGADVFTYMNAARETPRKFTLTTNWRSESRLVNAVNTIFAQPDPFLLEEIQFEPAVASPRADETPLVIGSKQEPPFHLWIAHDEDDLPDRVASEIVRLLASGATIGLDELEPRHIAVLTGTNAQAAAMQNALRARRVPSVLYSSANIFTSREAQELRDTLAAVVQPGHERIVRAALATDALGRTGNELDELSRDDLAWEAELLRFQQHHEIWRDRGFIQMLRHLAATHGVRQRLLSYPDGERRLTNFLHLAEVMHTACCEQRLGMNGLLKWLGQQMQGTSFADREEHELRLESDERAVRIITVHKSKGLEFDVVFCPHVSWYGPGRATFHDPEANWRLTLDLTDRDAHKADREREALAENLRQFYVALTRAKRRCTIVWRAKDKPDKSASARLLGAGTQPEIAANEDIVLAPLPEPNETQFVTPATQAPALEPRVFRAEIDRSWGIASFSRLISGRETEASDEGLVLDNVAPAEEPLPLQGIHAFPRGMRPGTCLHEILEELDFRNTALASELVSRKLRAYGIEGFDEPVLANVCQLSELALTADHFTLADVDPLARIPELEFMFPINAFTTAKLAAVFGNEIPLRVDRLQFNAISGFMTGFIDLIFEHGGRFYFLDWKSNWLGPDLSAYGPAAVQSEMQRHFYTLQLCLYTVALHRYLQVRKPGYDYDEHFGGALYIFLRGIDPTNPQNGVHHQRLDREFVEKLSAIFDR